MAIGRKRTSGRTVDNTGLNTSVTAKYARFINKDGSVNVINRSGSVFDKYSIYNYLINLKSWKFGLLIIGFYTTINLLFATIYYVFCIPHLQGLVKGTPLETFEEAYFFSSQTLTTVGYGRISPIGFITNTIASIEALVGILTLAIITGLLYGRFVKPRAYIRFSKHAIIAPFKGGKALMFRMAPIKNATLSEVSIQVTVSMLVSEDGQDSYRYFSLPLQFNTINALHISWTVVHPINEESPVYNMTMEELEQADFEMMIYLKAFDEDFSNTVIARTSYTYSELVNGAKFVPVYHDSPEGKGTIVELSKLHDYSRFPEAAI
ncbi:ion channel [Niabella beijingensis]|uniref:ion channel n=1 Tax=Niabella beijingensis TaxID=2872700 RepID=UPI001CBC45F5|nr:ion channel [Niabella beijingensis]MBZ4188590.1 Ion transport 2 domain protein [Niabella beijingensis]